MSPLHNGQAPGNRQSARRLRIDDLAAIVLRNSPGPAGATTTEMLEGGHSGRRFVLAAGMTVLLVWGTLYLFFRDWRAKYRERALYGTTRVVSVIEPLRPLLPPRVDPVAWRDAVDQTRAMLLTVTSSNLLDVKAMEALRIELVQHVRRACGQPATRRGRAGRDLERCGRPWRVLVQGQPITVGRTARSSTNRPILWGDAGGSDDRSSCGDCTVRY